MADIAQIPGTVSPGASWEESLRNVFSYGVSRAVDAEYLLPFYVDRTQDRQPGMDEFGQRYVQGRQAGDPAAWPWMPILLAAGGVALLFFLVKD